jgi:uncharacterized protein YndB with AHSA1/START domain
VHLERTLPAGIEVVWAAWTDPERMAGWLAPVDGVPGSGARFVLAMDADETATCTVTRWEPPRLLELTWDYTGEGPSRLRLELLELDGGGTRLVLDHDQLTDHDVADYGAGWHVELELLHAYLEGAAKPDFARRYGELKPLYDAAAAD